MPSSSRQSMSVLLVRAEQPNDEFVDKLIGIGAQVFRCPVMDIAPVVGGPEMQAIKSRILDFDHYQIAIFISKNAARYGLDWLYNYWPMLPDGVRYYAVGQSTAELLREHQLAVETPIGRADSEGLLALPSLQTVSGEKVLIFAGKGGREVLAQTLRQRGAEVDRCELYERCGTVQHADEINHLLQQSQLDILVAHSGELLQQLFSCVAAGNRHQLQALPVLVPGQRVADMARDLGCREVLEANSALPDDMVSTILEWYSNHG